VKDLAYEPYVEQEIEIDPNVQPRIESVLAKIPDDKTREKEFVTSLLGSAIKWGKLTFAQQRAFNKVEYNYSEEGAIELAEWRELYLAELQEDTIIAAKYYKERAKKSYEKYFEEAANRILENADYIPSKRLYHKMVRNKFAQKIIEQVNEDPKYAEGDCVQLRGSKNRKTMKEFFTSNGKRVFKQYPQGHQFIIVDNKLPAVNAVNGGRVYKILPFAEAEVLEVEERLIKKCRG